jgi:cytochrome P450
VEEKVTNIVSQTLRYRERNNVVRNDYLHILMQLKETSKDYDFTDVDVTAHAAGFIADGYESSSVVMSFLLYELANNPDVQSKLRQEIDESFAKHSNTMPYEAIQDMTYLDAVLSGTLRTLCVAFSSSLLDCRILKNAPSYFRCGKTVHQTLYVHAQQY